MTRFLSALGLVYFPKTRTVAALCMWMSFDFIQFLFCLSLKSAETRIVYFLKIVLRINSIEDENILCVVEAMDLKNKIIIAISFKKGQMAVGMRKGMRIFWILGTCYNDNEKNRIKRKREKADERYLVQPSIKVDTSCTRCLFSRSKRRKRKTWNVQGPWSYVDDGFTAGGNNNGPHHNKRDTGKGTDEALERFSMDIFLYFLASVWPKRKIVKEQTSDSLGVIIRRDATTAASRIPDIIRLSNLRATWKAETFNFCFAFEFRFERPSHFIYGRASAVTLEKQK